jgi:hypothetical protein
LANSYQRKRQILLILRQKENKFVPAPGHYKSKNEWVQKNKKCAFSKLPRLTFSEFVAKHTPRTPGPGAYNPNKTK